MGHNRRDRIDHDMALNRNRSGHLNQNWKGGKVKLNCMVCGDVFSVSPYRGRKAKCCCLACWNKYQKDNSIVHPRLRYYKSRGVRKKKWITKECRRCPSVFEVPPSLVTTKHFCSMACHIKWRSELNSGQANPNWRGGTRSEHYPPEFYAIRESILARDGYQCAVPMCRTQEDRVSVHHIDYNKKNCAPENLITACFSCNARANFNRVLWESLLAAFVRWRMATSVMNLGWRGRIEIHRPTMENPKSKIKNST